MDCAASAIVYSISSLVSEVRAFLGKGTFRSRYQSGFSCSKDEGVGVLVVELSGRDSVVAESLSLKKHKLGQPVSSLTGFPC